MDALSHGGHILTLDGGLGTTLETDLGLDLSTSPLWSSQALLDHPDQVHAAHMAFLKAGSDMITTATYQATGPRTAEGAGLLSGKDVEKMAVLGVKTAKQATIDYQVETGHRTSVVLSLGPYAACLSPTQEYSGLYPPPFGPSTETGTTFQDTEEGHTKETIAIQMLAKFHLARLRMFLSNEEIQQGVDCIAFETVPLAREVTAIRMAVGQWEEEIQAPLGKPWWITFVLPNGYSVETEKSSEHPLTAGDMAHRALRTDEGLATPDGVGVNCTGLKYLKLAVADMTQKIQENKGKNKVWLILYPNSGEVYEGEGRWAGGQKDWAEMLSAIVSEVEKDAWAGTVVGGCCRTGPKDIAELVKLVGRPRGVPRLV